MDLGAWLVNMPSELMLLQDEMLEETQLDFTPGSLAALEQELLGTLHDLDSEPDLVSATVRYVGEVLLEVGGGQWEWHAEAEVPAARAWVRLDAVPEPVSPYELLADVVAEATAEVLTEALDEVREAVLERIDREPAWRPHKVPTESLDPVVPAAELAEAERWWESQFAAFAARGLDFSPESLSAVERSARAGEPVSAWYLGEVLRCAAGGRWRVVAGQGTLVRPAGEIKEDEVTVDPAAILADLAQQPEGALRAVLDDWAGLPR